MTANAQGMSRQFMELRGQEVRLASDLAARQADQNALEQSLGGSENRREELKNDLRSGEERKQEAEANLAACRKELQKAKDEVTAANNAIAGYALRQKTRGERAKQLADQVAANAEQLQKVNAKTNVFKAMEKDNIPQDAVNGLKDAIDCNIYFFNNWVN